MHEALTGLLEKAELAISASGDILGSDSVDEVARLTSQARLRLDYPEEVLVVALAGGTGSGKSSLFNAITGSEAAPVGDIRPTTSRPMAALPMRHPGAMHGYLDHLGVEHRLDGSDPVLCLVDLPDTDSVEVSHRHRVEAIMPGIDVLVWVVDPEKYRDAALHHRFLRPLAGYASQFVFVLNQIDRLDPGSVDGVAADLGAALEEGGIGDPVVFTTSLAPGGPPRGVDELAGHLHSLAADRRGLYGKLLADLAESAARVSAMIGPPLGYRERVDPVVEVAARALATRDQDQVVSVITGFIEALAVETGGQVGAGLLQVAAGLPERVDEETRSLPAATPPRRLRWWRRGHPGIASSSETAGQAVGRLLEPVAEVVADRARALAAVTDLALEVERLRPLTGG